MNTKLQMTINFYRHYWPAFVGLWLLNIAMFMFSAKAWVITADLATIDRVGSSWWLQTFALTLLVNLQNGHRSLWRQLWTTPHERLVALASAFIGFACVTQLLPTLGWLILQGSQSLLLDFVSFGWAWLVSLSALLVALHCIESRSYQSALIVIAGLSVLAWSALPLSFQFVLPLLITAMLTLTFSTSKKLNQVMTAVLKFSGILIVSWVCLTLIDASFNNESAEQTLPLATRTKPALQASSLYQQHAQQQNEWASETNGKLRAIPSSNSEENVASKTLLVSNDWTTVQSIRPSPNLFYDNQDIKMDWLSQSLKNPSLMQENYNKEPSSYEFFMKQAELVWQNQNTTPPIFFSFQGDEFAIMDKTILRYHNSAVSVLWRDDDSLSWYAVSDNAKRSFIAFGHDKKLYLFTLQEQDAGASLLEFDLKKQPKQISFNNADFDFNMLDIDVDGSSGERIVWLQNQATRRVTTPAQFIYTTADSFNRPFRNLIIAVFIGLLWLTINTWRRQRHRQRTGPISL